MRGGGEGITTTKSVSFCLNRLLVENFFSAYRKVSYCDYRKEKDPFSKRLERSEIDSNFLAFAREENRRRRDHHLTVGGNVAK